MATTPKGLSDEKAARMMVALRNGRTLGTFGVKAPRLPVSRNASNCFFRRTRPTLSKRSFSQHSEQQLRPSRSKRSFRNDPNDNYTVAIFADRCQRLFHAYKHGIEDTKTRQRPITYRPAPPRPSASHSLHDIEHAASMRYADRRP
jgi:hypothetical protein